MNNGIAVIAGLQLLIGRDTVHGLWAFRITGKQTAVDHDAGNCPKVIGIFQIEVARHLNVSAIRPLNQRAHLGPELLGSQRLRRRAKQDHAGKRWQRNRRRRVGTDSNLKGDFRQCHRIVNRRRFLQHDRFTEIYVNPAHRLPQATEISQKPAEGFGFFLGAGLFRRVIRDIGDQIITDRYRKNVNVSGVRFPSCVKRVFEQAVTRWHQFAHPRPRTFKRPAQRETFLHEVAYVLPQYELVQGVVLERPTNEYCCRTTSQESEARKSHVDAAEDVRRRKIVIETHGVHCEPVNVGLVGPQNHRRVFPYQFSYPFDALFVIDDIGFISLRTHEAIKHAHDVNPESGWPRNHLPHINLRLAHQFTARFAQFGGKFVDGRIEFTACLQVFGNKSRHLVAAALQTPFSDIQNQPGLPLDEVHEPVRLIPRVAGGSLIESLV